MSGRIWERERHRLYFLNRWPSVRSMKRVRQKVKELTPRSRCHADIRAVIADLNPLLRGWGNYFRTGNASLKFQQIDRYVHQRLVRLMGSRYRLRRRAFHLRDWPLTRFVDDFGLHRLVGTIRYPGKVHAT